MTQRTPFGKPGSRLCLCALVVSAWLSAEGIISAQWWDTRAPLWPSFTILHEDRPAWEAPWVFIRRGAAVVPAYGAVFGYDYGYRYEETRLYGDVRFRFDDGAVGTFRVSVGSCPPPLECEGLPTDYRWVSVWDSRGQPVARFFVVAPYGWLEILALDLVDGPGDELLLVMSRGHASPSLGDEVGIYKLAGLSAVPILERYPIVGTLSTMPIACASWGSRLFIDASDAKPRPITVRAELRMPPDCRAKAADVAEARARDGEVLRYERGRYEALARPATRGGHRPVR